MSARKSLRVPDYILHIVAAIERIETYVEGFDLTVFRSSSLVQDAVIRNFEIIGEAAGKIQAADVAFAQNHPQLRLDLAYRMRNTLIHGYDSVNLETVWNTIQNDLPILKHQIAALSLDWSQIRDLSGRSPAGRAGGEARREEKGPREMFAYVAKARERV